MQIEIKRFLESVYGLQVERVTTMNYEGKKKRGRFGMYRRPDWKKAIVALKEPVNLPEDVFLGLREEAKEATQRQ